MTLYIGVDFHPYEQTVAYFDESDGEIRYRQFRHSDKQALVAFYRRCGKDACVGIEATGSHWWFERLLFDNGITLKIGNPRLIRRAALSRHKNDFRDAETILDLLRTGQFPQIVPRSEESRLVLALLNYRQSLVQKRTSVSNQLQAFAREKGLDKFRIKSRFARERLSEAAANQTEKTLLVGSRFLLFEQLSCEIAALEAELEKEADKEEAVQLLMTHPGVGRLTAMALVHTLVDVRRFRRKQEVVAFVGLDPLEKSSGQKKRIGQISKHGSRLLRCLLGQAAQASRDKIVRSHYSQVSRRRGRPKAKVAAARKLLVNCYVMLRDRIDYEEFRRRGEVGLCVGTREMRQAHSLNQ
jgi:transposase